MTTSIVDPVAHGWMGMELADYLFGGRYPQDNAEWLTFFEHLTTAYDAVKSGTVSVMNEETERVTAHRGGTTYEQPLVGASVSKIPRPVREHVRQLIDDGWESGRIRVHIQELYGIAISSSYMSHLRRRWAVAA